MSILDRSLWMIRFGPTCLGFSPVYFFLKTYTHILHFLSVNLKRRGWCLPDTCKSPWVTPNTYEHIPGWTLGSWPLLLWLAGYVSWMDGGLSVLILSLISQQYTFKCQQTEHGTRQHALNFYVCCRWASQHVLNFLKRRRNSLTRYVSFPA